MAHLDRPGVSEQHPDRMPASHDLHPVCGLLAGAIEDRASVGHLDRERDGGQSLRQISGGLLLVEQHAAA